MTSDSSEPCVCLTLQITQPYCGASRQGDASSSTRATWGQVSELGCRVGVRRCASQCGPEAASD